MLQLRSVLCCSVVLVTLVLVQSLDAQGFYTIVGSKLIRPHSNFHVAVNLHDATAPNSVRLTIQNDVNFRLVKEIVVQPHATESVTFELDDLPAGEYRLIAEGLTGISFQKETKLQVNNKRLSILVQTDKAMYKPGDLMRFRILVLDPNTKPLPVDAAGSLQVHISDGRMNRIRQWSNATMQRGVFSGELQLSDYPVLGKWTLEANVLGATKKHTVEVAEYVLPKFEVLIETEKNVLYKDGTIRANIRAKYTYGKPVRGEATVTVQPKIHGAYQPLIGDLVSRKFTKILLKGSVEFDVRTDLKLTTEYERELQMDVLFEEELTGRKQSAQTVITIRRSPFKIRRIGDTMMATEYRRGEPFQLEVQVTRHDGQPLAVTNANSEIELSYSHLHVDRNYTETHTLDKLGRVKVSWMLPLNESGVYIRAKYMDLIEGLGRIDAKRSTSASRLQTTVMTDKPMLGKPIVIEVQSEKPFSSYTYQIFGRGDILLTETIEVPNVTRHEIKFLASFAMVPKVKIIVYHIANDRMFTSVETITLRDQLQNTITLESSTMETRPGQNVELKITTRPNSFVGLLGVDQSVVLLKSGNDLSQNEVFDELEEYSKTYETRRWQRSVPISEFALERYSVAFDSVGAFVMSNLFEPNPAMFVMRSQFDDRRMDDFSFFMPVMPATILRPKAIFTIRRKFGESWLWDNLNVGSDGVHTLQKQVPDTITSWVITAFALDPVTGLAITQQPTKLRVFQPFFVSLTLPYSVKRGEVVSVPIAVFNYMESAVNAEVTLHNEDQDFEFVEISNELTEAPAKIELYRRKRVAIKSNDGAAISFMIRPKRIGPLSIKVTATSALAGDGIVRILPVEPEGVPVYANQAQFIDLSNSARQSLENLTVDIPKNAVPDSTRVWVSVIGDILGATIKNLDSLIRMPSGCGEQNMLNFVPNIVILNYLKNTNQLTDAIETKAKRYMSIGYQRELNYRHRDGSFSAFGESDSSGSTWLTAFVARSFRQAAEHVDIEETIIGEALKFLAARQADNGSFPEVGQVVHADMQGGAGQGIALTAYTLIAFLENKQAVPTYRNVINKAMDYIVRNLELLDDVYAQSLAAYALQLAEHNAKDFVLRTLDAKATRTADQMYWQKPVAESDRKNVWYARPNSVNNEMTAYGLLAHIRAGPYTEALPIMKWLLLQRNALGGFESTQDTVVGLQALAEVAMAVSSSNSDMRLSVQYGDGQAREITLNGANRMVLQEFALPASVRSVNVTANGRGRGLLSLSYKYNVNVTGAWPRFTVDPQVNRNSNPDYLHLTVCTKFVPIKEGRRYSNMAVMEVSLPSGFVADLDTIPSLEATESVKKVETQNGDTVMVIYFDRLGTKELCPTVDAFRTHKVAMQKPAAVTVYDYYDTTRRARMFYRVQQAGLCDICEDECPDTCVARTAEQRADAPQSGGSGGGSTTASSGGGLNIVARSTLLTTVVALAVHSMR